MGQPPGEPSDDQGPPRRARGTSRDRPRGVRTRLGDQLLGMGAGPAGARRSRGGLRASRGGLANDRDEASGSGVRRGGFTMTARRRPRWSELRPLLRTRGVHLNPTERRLADVASIADLRLLARRRAPRAVFDYTDGAAGDEIALLRSRQAYARVEFQPTVLTDVSAMDTSTTILGRPAALPLVFGPTGFTRMMHTEGEPAVARVAAGAGIPYALSTMGTTSVERLAGEGPGGGLWFQLYLWRDREASRDLVERARAAGYEALVLTVDTPVPGRRLRDERNGLTIPPALSART